MVKGDPDYLGRCFTQPIVINEKNKGKTKLEWLKILAWGLRNMKSYQLSDVDHPQIVFECGHHKIETEMMKNIKKNPNFSKSNLFFDIVSIN